MNDPQKQRLYALETVFWAAWNVHAAGMHTVMRQQEWEGYCDWLLVDGLHDPYVNQRRRSRTQPLRFVELAQTEHRLAFAQLQSDVLGVQPDFRMKYIAMHEVSHLLTRELRQNSHGWRFVSVYAQMVGRHISEAAARQFRGLAHAQSIRFTQSISDIRFVA